MATRSSTRTHCRPKWMCKPPSQEVRQAKNEVRKKLCRLYPNGNCHYGDRCKFKHQTWSQAWSQFKQEGIHIVEDENPFVWQLTEEDFKDDEELLLTEDEAADAEKEKDAGDRDE